MSFDSLVRASGAWSDYTRLEGYFDGTTRLDALGVTLPPELRVLEMIAPWPKLSVEVLNEVLTVEGFTLAGETVAPARIREWWQANDLDTEFPLVTAEALVQGVGFLVAGPGEDGVPRITGHDKRGMAVARDHMGRISEAVRKYVEGDEKFAAHYQRGVTDYYRHGNSGWVHIERRETNSTRVPVVPVRNRARLKDRNGRSEMLEVMKLADAGSRSLTNLQVAQELLALPQRYLFADGLDKMRDQNGNPVSEIEAYLGRLLKGPAGATAGQFPGADLSQIINTIKLYAQMVSSITGIPPSMLGISTDNPSSAEAMRAAKERLITKAEAKQAMFGDPLEEIMSICLEMVDGVDPRALVTLEAVWRDPATPSLSAKSANGLQAHAQGVITAKTARDFLQLTPAQKEAEDAAETGANALVRGLGL